MPTNNENDLMKYDELIYQYANDTGLPVNYIKSIIIQESSGNPNAKSPSGAQGLMQLMPGTATELGVTDPFDPEQSIRGGTQYIKPLYDEFGPYGGWGAYNMGRRGFMEAQAGKRPMPTETSEGMAKLQQNYQPEQSVNYNYFSDSTNPALSPPVGGMPPRGAPGNSDALGIPNISPVSAQTPLAPPNFTNMPEPHGPVAGAVPEPHGPATGGKPSAKDPERFGESMGGSESAGRLGTSASPTQEGPKKLPRPGEGASDGEIESPSALGATPSYAPPEGSVNVPSPESNPGFWETMRLAAKEDPATFYMVLADAAVLNVEGIKHTMQQRESNLLARADLQMKTATRVQNTAERNIDRIRAKAAAGGYLDRFETEIGGQVDTPEEAKLLQNFVSKEKFKEAEQEEFDNASNELGKFIRNMVKNPTQPMPKNISWINTVYGEDQYDGVVASIQDARKQIAEKQEADRQESDAKLKMMQERLELAKRQADYQAQKDTIGLLIQRHRLEVNQRTQLRKRLDTNYWNVRFDVFDETQQTVYEGDQRELERLNQSIMEAEAEMNKYAPAISTDTITSEGKGKELSENERVLKDLYDTLGEDLPTEETTNGQ